MGQPENEDFEVILTLVNLARSGVYRDKDSLFAEMYRRFPEITEEQLKQVVGITFKRACSNT